MNERLREADFNSRRNSECVLSVFMLHRIKYLDSTMAERHCPVIGAPEHIAVVRGQTKPVALALTNMPVKDFCECGSVCG